MAALLEAEKLKANESGVNGAALPEGWVDLTIEDLILQFRPAVEVRRAAVRHMYEDADQYVAMTRQYMRDGAIAGDRCRGGLSKKMTLLE